MATNPNTSPDLFKKRLEETRPEREKKEADILKEMSGTPAVPKTELPIASVGTPLEQILDKSRKAKTLQEKMALREDLSGQILKGQQAEAQAAEERVLGQAQAKGQFAIQEAEAYKKIDDERQRKMAQLAIPEFKPTQDNLLTLGTMASLIAVVGAVVGGQGGLSGIGAVNAMAGMMQGYSQGRKDVFDREKVQFQNEMATLKAKQDALMKEFEAAYKRMPYDMAGAKADMEMTLAKYDAKFLKATYDRQGPEMVLKRLDESIKDMISLQKMAAKTGIGKLDAKLEKAVGGNVNLMKGLSDLSKMVDMVKDEPFVFGILSGNLPLSMVQYVQSGPAKQTISLLQNITSQELKLRSGATVTVQEFARSRGFLPVRDDSPATIQSKIRGLYDAIQSETEGFADNQKISEGLRENLVAMPQPLAPSFRQQARGGTPPTPAGKKPTLDEFLSAARSANPGSTDKELTEYYNDKYGK